MKVSVVIPAYNEESIIGKNTERLIEFLDEKNLECEIFLCNNGSTDNTLKVMESFQREFPQIKIIKNKKI